MNKEKFSAMDKKEAAYLLQRVDCNCNDCGFMKRDLEAYNKAQQIARAGELWLFENRKERLLEKAKKKREDGQPDKAEQLEKQVAAMKFQYSAGMASYGHCQKFDKPVTFIPGICQIETQKCFIHRKDYIHEPTKNQDHE